MGRLLLLAMALLATTARADSLAQLANDFWQWRAAEQPVTADDIVRVDRPLGWQPRWSAQDVHGYERALVQFETRWRALGNDSAPVAQRVDYALMGSAIERVRWELVIQRTWRRNPDFYVDQSVTAYVTALLPPPPFAAERAKSIVRLLDAIPGTLADARTNLTEPAAPFAQLALQHLDGLGPRLIASVDALAQWLPAVEAARARSSAKKAVASLEAYRAWLKSALPRMQQRSAVNRKNYVFFLHHVALLPYTPEQILAMGHQEWARAVASQDYEECANSDLPALTMPASMEQQAARQQAEEQQVRDYLTQHHVLTVPAWMPHYRFEPMPAYLAPLPGFTETDDFTSPTRHTPGIRYIEPPSSSLGYFAMAMAKEPRSETVHEGVPGHYFQLVLSWTNPDPIRRHYYDSSANEGIGFYSEELMLHAGLFNDNPKAREILWNFMRLRALRVEVDVKLALGLFTLDQAADYLARSVPMDKTTALEEASFFASVPGQAISYEIGKLQILSLLADMQRRQGERFSLQAFHDHLWLNGNVPIALQRWELLGERPEIQR